MRQRHQFTAERIAEARQILSETARLCAIPAPVATFTASAKTPPARALPRPPAVAAVPIFSATPSNVERGAYSWPTMSASARSQFLGSVPDDELSAVLLAMHQQSKTQCAGQTLAGEQFTALDQNQRCQFMRRGGKLGAIGNSTASAVAERLAGPTLPVARFNRLGADARAAFWSLGGKLQ